MPLRGQVCPQEVPKPAAQQPVPKRGGIIGRMQSALATALKSDPVIEEF